MRRCAFLTLDDPTGYILDDHLAYEPLSALGWQVEEVPWRRTGVDWKAFDAVVIRSTWDYTKAPEEFLAALAAIDQSGVKLFNRLELVRWNVPKTYLGDLARRGVPIVPTVWRGRLRRGELIEVLTELGAADAVVKPVIGAGAVGAFRLNRQLLDDQSDAVNQIENYYARREMMAQPFLTAIDSEGEYSLFYFNGNFSHAVLKTPCPGDFRVQEEHGGIIRPVEPTADLRIAGDQALQAIGQPPLYARADLVRSNAGAGFWLMELELIEPSLYLRMDEHAPARFAEAIDQRFSGVWPKVRKG